MTQYGHIAFSTLTVSILKREDAFLDIIEDMGFRDCEEVDDVGHVVDGLCHAGKRSKPSAFKSFQVGARFHRSRIGSHQLRRVDNLEMAG